MRHEWTDRGKKYYATDADDGRLGAPLPTEEEAPSSLPDYVNELHRADGQRAAAREILRLTEREDRLAAHLRAFLSLYDASDGPNPLLFFEIMHERAAAIRRDLGGATL